MNAPLTHSLDAQYYTDPAIFEQEMQGLLARTWQFGCHVELSKLARVRVARVSPVQYCICV